MRNSKHIQKTCRFTYTTMLAVEQFQTDKKIPSFNDALNTFLEEAFSKEKEFNLLMKKLEEIAHQNKLIQHFLLEQKKEKEQSN